MKKNPEAIKIIQDHLDKIYSTAVKITVAYNSQYIPLNLLWEILQKSKMKKNKELKDFPKQYNTMIDKLYAASFSYCERNDLKKRLPMEIFKRFISQLKDNL